MGHNVHNYTLHMLLRYFVAVHVEHYVMYCTVSVSHIICPFCASKSKTKCHRKLRFATQYPHNTINGRAVLCFKVKGDTYLENPEKSGTITRVTEMSGKCQGKV